MLELNLPKAEFKVKKIKDRLFIWDKLRHKYVALSPEEWVRQHFVHYLLSQKAYPETLIVNEFQIILNETKKRCDSVIYDRNLRPLVILEYKAPGVKITQSTFDQIVRYNIVLKVPYLIVSNGLEHYCCKVDYEKQKVEYLQEIPNYEEIL